MPSPAERDLVVPTPESVEGIDRVFKPGDFIWGTLLEAHNVRSIFERGIVPAQNIEGAEVIYPWTKNQICLGMIGKTQSSSRMYLHTIHMGPKPWDDVKPPFQRERRKIGIIVSRESLVAQYPDELFAVGDYFIDKSIGKYPKVRQQYDIDRKKKTVFGLPIREVQYPYFLDEARLIPKDPTTAAIQSQHWRAIVIWPDYWNEIRGSNIEAANLQIPVFSPEMKLLANSFTLDSI